MHNTKNFSICVCYETGCSGETIATENIIRVLHHYPNVQVYSYSHSPLIHTSSWGYFSWVIHSIFYWLTILYRKRDVDWVYTTTFTAGVAASVLKVFFPFHLAWNFQGSRIPPPPKKLRGMTYTTQLCKYFLTRLLHSFFVNNTDIIFVPCRSSERYLMSELPEVACKNIVYFPNGVDMQKFHGKKRRNVRGVPTLASINILDDRKNVLKLYRVALQIKKHIPQLKFLIAFPHPLTSRGAEIKKQLQLQAKKHTWIHLVEDPAHIEEIYASATIVVSLTREDQFPLILLESFATKTIFMATPKGEIPTLLSCVDPRLIIMERSLKKITQHIVSMFQLPDTELDTIRTKGYHLAQTYTWEHSVQELMKSL